MTVQLYRYDLLDWGGGVERSEFMTEEEAKQLNKELWEKEPRLLRWAKSYNQTVSRKTKEIWKKEQRSRN